MFLKPIFKAFFLKKYRFIVQYLLDNGAMVSAVNSTEGANAAHWAAIAGKTKNLHLLFASGIDLNSVDKRGYNCLLHAVYDFLVFLFFFF